MIVSNSNRKSKKRFVALGELVSDPVDLTTMQKLKRKMLRLHLAKLNWPRFNVAGIRALDYVHRNKSLYADWTSEVVASSYFST